jgi:hypothetical protein
MVIKIILPIATTKKQKMIIKYDNLFNGKVNDQVEVARVFKEKTEIKEKILNKKWLDDLDDLPQMGPSDWLVINISLQYLLCTELEIHYYYYY